MNCRVTAPKHPRPKGARFYGDFDKNGIPFEITKPVEKTAKLGGWEGKITVADDFNEPMDEFKEYME